MQAQVTGEPFRVRPSAMDIWKWVDATTDIWKWVDTLTLWMSGLHPASVMVGVFMGVIGVMLTLWMDLRMRGGIAVLQEEAMDARPQSSWHTGWPESSAARWWLQQIEDDDRWDRRWRQHFYERSDDAACCGDNIASRLGPKEDDTQQFGCLK